MWSWRKEIEKGLAVRTVRSLPPLPGLGLGRF
jgi:hypothetical protein